MHTDELNTWRLGGAWVPRSRRIPVTAWPQGSGLPRYVYGWVESWDIVAGFGGTGAQFVLRLADPPALQEVLGQCPVRGGGELMTAQEVLQRVESLRAVLTGPDGEVVVAGAEPLRQAGFTSAVVHLCQEERLRTTLVTSGQSGSLVSDLMLSEVDLFVVDLPAGEARTYLPGPGRPAAEVLRFLGRLALLQRPTRVRLPVVKGRTDTPADLEDIARYLSTLSNLRAVDVYSWPLGEPADLESVRTTLRLLGLPVADDTPWSLTSVPAEPLTMPSP